jgi:hypothetical protein
MADLAKEIIKQFAALAKGYGLTAREKQLLRECAADAAALEVQVLSGQLSPEKAKREKGHISTQLKSIKSIAGGRLTAIFWKAVNIAVGVLLKAASPV